MNKQRVGNQPLHVPPLSNNIRVTQTPSSNASAIQKHPALSREMSTITSNVYSKVVSAGNKDWESAALGAALVKKCNGEHKIHPALHQKFITPWSQHISVSYSALCPDKLIETNSIK